MKLLVVKLLKLLLLLPLMGDGNEEEAAEETDEGEDIALWREKKRVDEGKITLLKIGVDSGAAAAD